MKRNIIALLVVVMVLCCCLTLAACNNKTNVLDNYIFEMDGTTVSDDFVLPATIGGEKAEWKSNNGAVQIEKRESDVLAKVTLPEKDAVEVTLTVTVKKVSKSYTVIVKALDVYDFMNNYVFPKNKATIVDNFDLETEFTYKGKKATIAWSVSEAYELYIKVIEGGKKLQVTPQSKQTPVDIKATFTYKGVSSSKNYHMTVYKTLEGMELVNYWYNNTPVSVDMSGYVVSIARNFDEKFGNVSFYMVNDDFSAGYYIYNVKSNAEQSAKLVPGVHVTVTGTTNTNYNGLVETTGGGKFVIDADKPAINVAEKVRAIDEEVLGNLPSTVYSESRLVSLSNWSVDSVKTPSIEGKEYVILTLKKGGKTVDVVVSKYMEGAYAPKAGDATFDALCALGKTFTVGKTVNVTGILSKFGKNWQIMPLSATAVTESGKDADPADKKDYVGMQIATAMGKVNAQLLKDGIVDKDGKTVRITNPTDFTLLNKDGNVTVAYQVVGTSNAVVFDQNKMTVTPGNPETTTVLATYKLGDYEAIQFIYVESLIPTAASMLDDLKVPKKIKEVAELPTAPSDATLTWEVVDGKESVVFKDGQLYPTLKEFDVPTIVRATLTYKGVTRTKDFVVVVKAGKEAEMVTTFEENKAYVLALVQKNLGKTLYALTSIKDNFLESTDEPDSAANYYVEKTDVEGSYRLYFKNSKGEKKYLNYKIEKNKDGKDTPYLTFVDKEAHAWKWDSKNKCFSTSIKLGNKTEDYYFGAYNQFETIGLSKTSFVSSSFPAFLGNIKFEPLASGNITVALSHANSATVKVNPEKSALNGERITFTVQAAENWKVVKVYVNGKTVEAVNGVYTAHASGDTKISVKTVSTVAQSLVPEIKKTMQAGTYKFVMDTTAEGGDVLYAKGKVNTQGALETTTNLTEAADFVVEAVAGKTNVYTIKVGDQYLVGFLSGKINNMKLDAAPGEWTWNDTIKAFTCTFKDKDGKNTEFFFGAYYNASKDSVGNTMALSKVSFVTGDNAKNVGKTQFIGYACTLKAAE